MRRWAKPVDLPLSLFKTKHNWSLAPAQANMDSARSVTIWRPNVVLAASPNWFGIIRTHTRLSWRACAEPVDFPLLLSQTKHNGSIAPAQANMDSARSTMAAQCGAGGQPKLAILSTHKRLWCCCYMRGWSAPVDFPLLLSQTKHKAKSVASTGSGEYGQR